MYNINLGKSGLNVPTLAVGCMRINSVEKKEGEKLVKTALENGTYFFDHADIYGGGECESIFADVIGMNDNVREKIVLQTKCGIVPGKMFDFSKEHILKSVDGSLKRLKTDYIDVLLLHRPDALCEPEEVGEAFDILKSSGKVKHFGVSNQNPMQMKILQKGLNVPIVANQLQLSLGHNGMISNGIHVNMNDEESVCRDGSVLDFCRLEDITVQAWSPFQHGFFRGTFIDNPQFKNLNDKMAETAEKYNTTKTAIAIAWILRHPAKIQPVTGTMNSDRLKECIKATQIRLSREDWYALYLSSGHILP